MSSGGVEVSEGAAGNERRDVVLVTVQGLLDGVRAHSAQSSNLDGCTLCGFGQVQVAEGVHRVTDDAPRSGACTDVHMSGSAPVASKQKVLASDNGHVRRMPTARRATDNVSDMHSRRLQIIGRALLHALQQVLDPERARTMPHVLM
jgi:hypothetical protein